MNSFQCGEIDIKHMTEGHFSLVNVLSDIQTYIKKWPAESHFLSS